MVTVDQYGFMSSPQVTVFNNDPGIAPPGTITASVVSGTCSALPVVVSAHLTNIFGLPVADGTQVLFQPAYGGPTIATPVSSTINGVAQATITSCTSGTSAIEVEYGNLPAYLVPLM